MSTSHIITVGYNSSNHKSEVWDKLKSITATIRNNPKRLFEEIVKVEGGTEEELMSFCDHMKDCDDLSLTVIDSETDMSKRCVLMCSSGGGDNRESKEKCRRAFCRLVLHEMHKCGMEVSINVS